MGLKITRVYGGNEQAVVERKHNILIAISLGNKWFTKENLKEYIEWALKNSKDRVLIWVADKINAVNYEVKDKKSSEVSLRRALREGDRKLSFIQNILLELPKKECNKVDIVRHSDLELLDEYIKLKEYFHQKFNKDQKFREAVLVIVKSTISLRFNESQIEKLSEYVLNELPLILSSFKYKNIEYSCYPYPVNTRVAEFVEKIQMKEIFPEICNEIKFKNMVCVQLEVLK
jgi:tRNA-dependent cyclodipeptide synthase